MGLLKRNRLSARNPICDWNLRVNLRYELVKINGNSWMRFFWFKFKFKRSETPEGSKTWSTDRVNECFCWDWEDNESCVDTSCSDLLCSKSPECPATWDEEGVGSANICTHEVTLIHTCTQHLYFPVYRVVATHAQWLPNTHPPLINHNYPPNPSFVPMIWIFWWLFSDRSESIWSPQKTEWVFYCLNPRHPHRVLTINYSWLCSNPCDPRLA